MKRMFASLALVLVLAATVFAQPAKSLLTGSNCCDSSCCDSSCCN